MTFINLLATLPTIDLPAPEAPPGSEGVMTIIAWVVWLAAAAGVVGLIFLGVRMLLSNQRGEGMSEFSGKLGIALGALVLIASSAGIVTMFLGA